MIEAVAEMDAIEISGDSGPVHDLPHQIEGEEVVPDLRVIIIADNSISVVRTPGLAQDLVQDLVQGHPLLGVRFSHSADHPMIAPAGEVLRLQMPVEAADTT